MKQPKWTLLLYSILAAAGMMGIGVAIAERSLLGIVSCIAAVIVVMGMGFTTKKKLREKGEI
ncbi:YlaF family protein [Bacillus rubiinfantis]|uniref:YlaF family protein n=1 Tax=Bacillus rubiinfantis TaxID=1499680 RepID=UPI0005A88752|nr:YlaF family protein [Bacillus rubiinfantis]